MVKSTKSINKFEEIVNKRNQSFLGIFMIIITITIAARIILGIMWDLGFSQGKTHIGYWVNPQLAWEDEFKEFQNKFGVNKTWNDFLKVNPDVNAMIKHHPSVFWIFTQFTWLTTFIVFFIIVFRFFKFESMLPKWLKWIMSQRTLSTVTIYDAIVGIVFWSAMFEDFSTSFEGSLWIPQVIVTIFVHTVIPILLIVYSVIFLIYDRRASIIRARYLVKSIIFPVVYSVYYVVLTIIWEDPYPVTNMHSYLMQTKIDDPNWSGWAQDFWKLVLFAIFIYVAIGIMLIIHNVILIYFNKKYNPKKDEILINAKHNNILYIKKKILKLAYENRHHAVYKKVKKAHGKKKT